MNIGQYLQSKSLVLARSNEIWKNSGQERFTNSREVIVNLSILLLMYVCLAMNNSHLVQDCMKSSKLGLLSITIIRVRQATGVDFTNMRQHFGIGETLRGSFCLDDLRTSLLAAIVIRDGISLRRLPAMLSLLLTRT